MSRVINGTAVAVKGRGVLLQGASGAGKSDLALRMIDRGARLISDDRVVIESVPEGTLLKAHPEIAGMLEIRGVGITRKEFTQAFLMLVVEIENGISPERMPEEKFYSLDGLKFPLISLNAFHASAPVVIESALEKTYE